jgi:hypothetical protein
MSQGGSLSINPETGLPEAFKLGGFFKSLLPTIVGGIASMIPGMQFASYPMLTGILAGSATGALTNKNKLLGAITGGLGGYSGAGIMGAGKAAAGAMGSAEAAKSAATNAGIGGGSSGLTTGGGFIPGATSGADLAYNNAMLASQSGGIANSAVSGASGAMDIEKALAAGRPIGMANTFANTASLPPDPTFLGNMGDAFKGFGGAATGNQAAIDAYTKGIGAESALGALGKTALPFGGAAITGGLEASDLYGEPIQNASKEDKYDPYSKLYLGNDTGLRLVAEGGYIDGYAVGGTVNTSGVNDAYNSLNNPTTPELSRDGYGVGRLNDLASQQSLDRATVLGYAEGGVANLELQDPTVPAEQPINPEISVINEIAKTQDNEKQMNNLGLASLDSGNVPTNNYAPGSLATIVNAMKNQPIAPENAFIQNLTSARTGYAEGGDVGMNLDALPSLNVNLAGKPNEDQSNSSYAGPDIRGPGYVNPALASAISRLKGGTGIPTPAPNQLGMYGTNSPLLGILQQISAPKPQPKAYALNVNSGKQEPQYARGGYLNGDGDGMSDSIPATIEGKQPARLADGEFVVPADVVSHIGNGSSKAGSKRLYAMLDKVRHARTGNKKQGKQINPAKYMPA